MQEKWKQPNIRDLEVSDRLIKTGIGHNLVISFGLLLLTWSYFNKNSIPDFTDNFLTG